MINNIDFLTDIEILEIEINNRNYISALEIYCGFQFKAEKKNLSINF